MMSKFESKSFGLGAIVVTFTLGLASPLILRSDGLQFPDGTIQTTAASPDSRKAFYLTHSFHAGGATTVACANGFHMASLWEIFDVSNLRYAREQPDAKAYTDSGQGPPVAIGWIRTGGFSDVENVPGSGNCDAWMSFLATDYGSRVHLADRWDGVESAPAVGWLGPWVVDTGKCSNSTRVWCIED